MSKSKSMREFALFARSIKIINPFIFILLIFLALRCTLLVIGYTEEIPRHGLSRHQGEVLFPLIKYFMFSSGNRSHNKSRLQPHVCTPTPQLASITQLQMLKVCRSVLTLGSFCLPCCVRDTARKFDCMLILY